MPNQKVISMLGLARRAGRLSMGHDMAQHALFGHKAKLLLFCSDVSPRLISEFEKKIDIKPESGFFTNEEPKAEENEIEE